MRKKLLFLLAACAVTALLFVFPAFADGGKPTGGARGRDVPQEGDIASNAAAEFQSNTGLWKLSGPNKCKTGRTYTWTISDYAVHEYEYFMTVLDGSYVNPNTADIQYDETLKSTSFTYTFWFPGTYILFADIYVFGEYRGYDTLKIQVEDGGENKVTRMIREVAGAQKTNDEFQTVKNLHDWILDNCTYDYSYTLYSADAVFLLHRGVCNSYARAFVMLLKEAGIACRRVGGYAFGDPDSGHAWNAVRINGQWYLFDLTWDDAGDSLTEKVRYQYFAVPDSVFSIEHTGEKYVGGYVECSSVKDNYFVHTGKWENYTGNTLNQYREWQDLGMHRFWLEPPDCTNDSYFRALLGTVVAYEMNFIDCPDSQGRVRAGRFEYDVSLGQIVGMHLHTGTIELPKSLEAVSGEMLTGSRATLVVVPEGCVSVGTGAFDGMDLWEVRVPASVGSLSLDAFADNRPSRILIVAPENSAAHRFAEDHINEGFFWMPE